MYKLYTIRNLSENRFKASYSWNVSDILLSSFDHKLNRKHTNTHTNNSLLFCFPYSLQIERLIEIIAIVDIKTKVEKNTHREKQKLDIKLTDRYERLNKPEITSTSNLDLNQRKEIVHINFSGALMCKIDFKCIPDYCCAFGFTTVRRTQFSKWKKISKYRTTQIDIVTPYVEFQHNRPINPISTRDYFRLLSFFSILLLNQ